MKVNYFGYYIIKESTNEKYLTSISGLLKNFCKYDNSALKNKFTYEDENLYLLHHVGDTFLFMQTRNNELIKKINTQNISLGEIHSLLSENEKIGFASYVLLKDDYFGYGSTLLAPKVDVFIGYINELLRRIGQADLRVIPHVLLHQATKAEILAMDFIGKTTFELSKQNSFVQDIIASISGDSSDTLELDGIEIIIKPKLRQNIKPLVSKFMSNIPDSGIEKMFTKAKDNASSQLIDLYMIGRGAISDNIDKTQETKIPELLESKCESNKFLKKKITEFRQNDTYEKNICYAVLRFNDFTTWTTIIPII